MNKYKVIYKRNNELIDTGYIYATNKNEAIDKFFDLEEFEQIDVINAEKVNGV